ncbi:thyroid adenoma-associated protein homolog [Chrysoperla carnea]|uniref:thyroid adenoma-associated protein homolog n=1 Tax=Chrysoperla carnea TaxID=189513 RepID=UPI001D07922D|nr:thyroid adenoma-associated protein homolog [Chrysoperla carnea]
MSLLNEVDKYKVLLMVYLICPYKHPAKKTLARILSIQDKETSDEEFVNNLQDYLQAIIEHDQHLKYFRYAINTCFDHFPAGVQAVKNILEQVLQKIPDHLTYLNSIISSESESVPVSSKNKKDIAEEIHDYSRAIISVVSLCTNYKVLNIELNPSKLIMIVDLLIQNNSMFLSMDTKCNFGMIIVQCARLLSINNGAEAGPDVGALKEIICKLLRIKLNDMDEELWPKMKFTTESERICIVIGILNTLSTVQLYQVINNCEPLIISLSKYLFEIADTSCALLNTNELLIVCRGIVLISKKIYKLMEQKNKHHVQTLLQMFIKFVLIHLEHYCDTIRHNSKIIMIHLVKNAVQIMQQNDDSSILNELVKSVFNSSMNNESGLYSCLSILCTEAGCNVLFKYHKNLAQKIMSDVHLDSPYAHQIRTTYISLMTKHSTEVEIDVWMKLWIEPLINKIIEKNEHIDDNLKLFQEAISIQPQLSIQIIDTYKNDCNNPALFLICAKIARKFGISNENSTAVKWKGIIDIDLLENAFSHTSPTIRLSAIAIIADSRKTTEIFTLQDFNLIKSFLIWNLNCTDAAVRQDILAYYKKIWTRFKDSYLLIKRKLNDLNVKLSMANTNTNVKSMNYYRRTTTLEMFTLLKSILDTGTTDQILSIITNNINDTNSIQIQIQTINLIDCLYDGYEYNKQLALNILIGIRIPLECVLSSFSVTMDEMIDACMKLATSKKPADCITAAYLIHLILNYPESACNVLKSRTNSDIDCPYYLTIRLLIDQLQNDILVAKQNIVTAAGTAPLYGCIFIIRYLYLQVINKNLSSDQIWIGIIKEVIDLCFEISDLVLPIVNSQSPEGYFPEIEASTADNCASILNVTVTPQMVLLCAWRSVKEISLLYGDIVFYSKIINCKNYNTGQTVADTGIGSGTITEDQVMQIGNYFISVLATTKHRGAFEQTYVGFTKLCKRLWSEKSGKLADLPRNWIEELLVDITNTNEMNVNKKLCATRRSAGLPFMIQALETTALEVIGTVDLFKNGMETLLEICEKYRKQVNCEPCTHAMNILRALFRHNQLGEHCIQFISNGVIVALRAIETNNWALRNAGTLLFSALMTRIFGVLRNKNSEKLSSHNRMTIHVFFSRFPHLFDFLKEELRIASLSDDTLKLSLYPILLLLARLYPSVFEESQSQFYQISSLLPYLNECCKNRIYKTRELAAKAIVPLLDRSNIDKYFIKLLNELITSDQLTTNCIHGILLQRTRSA